MKNEKQKLGNKKAEERRWQNHERLALLVSSLFFLFLSLLKKRAPPQLFVWMVCKMCG
jgi:hypothetical protein